MHWDTASALVLAPAIAWFFRYGGMRHIRWLRRHRQYWWARVILWGDNPERKP